MPVVLTSESRAGCGGHETRRLGHMGPGEACFRLASGAPERAFAQLALGGGGVSPERDGEARVKHELV